MKSPSNADLPADITRDILSRLPVKILLKFKCVCKDWYTIIESQSFVNEHFVNKNNRERLLLFKPNRRMHVYGDESSSERDHLPMPERVSNVIGPVNGVFCVVNVIGPVNGVFCVVSDSGGMGLFNPAMRQFKPIPFLSCRPKYSDLGFGFDPLSGYYKVVSIHVIREVRSSPIVHVYNSGSDSWRPIENVGILSSLRCALRRSKLSTYLNGVYYWIMRYRDNGIGVLAFNMSGDEFQIIQIPDDIRGRHQLVSILRFVLVVCGDSIAILSYNISHFEEYMFVDMWVLENDGRWTNRSNLGPFRDMTLPLGFWKNNELMLETRTAALSMYNIFTHEFRHFDTNDDENRYFAPWVFTYKESLVSIEEDGKGNRDNCKLWNMYFDFIVEIL